MNRIISLLLCIVMLVPMIAAMNIPLSASPHGIIENSPVDVPFITPTVDGDIDAEEGWSDAALMNYETCGHYWAFNPLSTNADIFFAYDEYGLYYAADITEGLECFNEITGEDMTGVNSFIYSTEEDWIDISRDDPEDHFGYDGDIFGIMIDPLGIMLDAGFTGNFDYTPWYLVGLFEGDEARMYRQKVNQGDITDQVQVAGHKTEDGWQLEAAIPWDIIINDVEDITFGECVIDKAELVKSGAGIRLGAMYHDRFYDYEAGEVATWGRYVTAPSSLISGTPGHLGSGITVLDCGITLNLTNQYTCENGYHIFTVYTSDDNYTCTEDGTKTAYCDMGCGASDTIVDQGSAAHRYTREDILREPTCTKTGYSLMFCDCGANKLETLPAAPHCFTDYTYNNDATCTYGGTETAYCDFGCGTSDTKPSKGDNKLGHKFTNYIYNNDATCQADGTKTAYCDYGCGTADTVTAKGTRTDHNYEITVIEESSCTSNGLALYICSCNLYYIEDLPLSDHSYGAWEMITPPTADKAGVEKRSCSVCGRVETRETNELPQPEISVDNYTVTITNADYIKDMRYVLGTYTTTTEIRNAVGNVALDNKVVKNNTVDGKFIYDLPDGGVYSIWVRMQDGRNYILPIDMTKFTPSVTAYGVKITVDGLFGAKDFFIAKGQFNSYNEIKNNGYIVRVTENKIAGKHNYTYTVSEPGMHTVLVRYNDGTEHIFHEELTVDEPVFTTNGLQVTVSNIPDVKVIRTAYGEYYTPGDTKRAAGARNFSNKAVIKDAEEYMLQYREEGRVTVIVEYNNGYVKVFHYDVVKKAPTVEQDENSVTFGDLDGLVMIRYAVGEYTTSTEIKAAGGKVIKPDAIVDGKITVSELTIGETYTFSVQYDDESYYIVTITAEEKIVGYFINGNPIEDYTIVYSTDSYYGSRGAKALAEYIKNATDITLDVITDSQEPEGPEILVGKTNREDMGLVKADRDGDRVDSFEISVQGDFVVIAGKQDNRSDRKGTVFGVYAFAEEILGYHFYSDDVYVIDGKGINVPDGYVFKDGPGFEYRVVYWGGLVSDELSTGEPFKRRGVMHNMCELVGFGDARSPDPCLTYESNLATIEKNFLKMLTPDLEAAWVTQNDTSSYCRCSSCMAVYREEGSRSGTLMRLMNRLAAAAEREGYPDVEIWTFAYEYSINPCYTKLDDNIVVYYCPIRNCTSHAYNDSECNINKTMTQNIEGWDAITKKMYIWDYSTNFSYSQTPMPLTKVFRENRNWFYSHGIRGEFNNAVDSRIGEFDALKAYLIAELQWDPTMDEETYRGKIADFLDAYYGPGGKYINEYIVLTEELSDKNCFGYNSTPSSVITNADTLANAERIEALWDAAEDMCENETQRMRIRRSRASWTYLYLDALYTTTYVGGSEAQRADYEAKATEYYNEVKNYRLKWSESGGTTINFNPAKSPVNW